MISSRAAFDHAHFVAVKSIPLSLRSAELPAIGQRSAFLHLEEFLTKFAQAHCGVEAKRLLAKQTTNKQRARFSFSCALCSDKIDVLKRRAGECRKETRQL
jgi:hypothetical protein